MATYTLDLNWNAKSDRDHYLWRLQNGAVVEALLKNGETAAEFMDPEEAFIASIASCHMLSFIAEAAKAGYSVEDYQDSPVAALGKNRKDRIFVDRLLLIPKAAFAGDNQPSDDDIATFHRDAQDKCYISNSVLTDIKVEPRL